MRLCFSLLYAATCLIPVWIYLLARHLLAPHGFLQNLIIRGFGVWILGTAQFIGCIFLVIGLVSIWE